MSTPRASRFEAGSSRVRSLAWSVDGRRLASGSDQLLRIWNPEKAASTEMRGHTADISSLRWHPQQPESLASVSASPQDKALRLWDIRQGSRPTASIELEGNSINLAWSPDGQKILVGNRGDVVSTVDIATQSVRTQQMKAETNEFMFSASGSLVYTCLDSSVAITPFPAGEHPIHSLHVSSVSCCTLDLDPKGRYIAVGSNDAVVTLFETTDWTLVQSLGHFDGPIRSVAFSHDGQLLASGSEDPFIVISSIPTGAEFKRIATGCPTSTLSYHPSKSILAYASEETEGGGRQSGVFRVVTI